MAQGSSLSKEALRPGVDAAIVKLSSASDSPTSGGISPQMCKGSELLLQGLGHAKALRQDPWNFAVEIQALRHVGLTNNDLRWMVCQGLLEHARECRADDQGSRQFRSNGLLTFCKRTCFVLTETGAETLEQELAKARGKSDALSLVTNHVFPCHTAQSQDLLHPKWDPALHQLYLGDALIKEFRLPSPNQGTILMAFEEEGWPARIDDPLPPRGEVDCKLRLRYTIKSLNKFQKHRLVRFTGDGTGEGVCWELITK